MVAIGALVAWYVGENGLEAEGIRCKPVAGDIREYNGVLMPDDSVAVISKTYPYAFIDILIIRYSLFIGH